MRAHDLVTKFGLLKLWSDIFKAPCPADEYGRARHPDFLCVGSEKAGTTWLWNCMMQHPGIGVPASKELRFFNLFFTYDTNHFRALATFLENPRESPSGPDFLERLATEIRLLHGGLPAYHRIFGQLSQPVVGEVTPQYCAQPLDQIRRMKEAAPEARIIYMLRDPVDRILSGARMVATRNTEPLTDDLLLRYAADPFQRNLTDAATHLDNFDRVFGANRVKAFFFDDIASRPAALLDDICAFIGAERAEIPDTILRAKVNQGGAFQPSAALKSKLYAEFAPLYNKLEQRHPRRVAGWRARYSAQ